MAHITPHLPGTARNPFQQELDPDVFFPGAEREEICQALILDLLTGKQLLHLSGDSGSGKSLVCRVIMERLPSSFTPVYLADPVGSYEDLVRHASIDLGAARGNRADDFSWPEEFNRQLLRRQRENVRVVLILDQAELLFSAALERLLQRNRLDTPDAPGFAMLLAGSGALNTLLSQLAAMGTENVPENSYFLPPLEPDQTEKYLRYRLHAAGIGWDDHDSILDKKSLSRIIKKSQGNIAQINEIASPLLATRLPQPAPAQIDAPQPPPPPLAKKPFLSLYPQEEALQEEAGPAKREAFPPYWEQFFVPSLIELYELLVGNRKILGAVAGVAVLLLSLGLLLDQRRPPAHLELEQASPSQTEAPQELSPRDVEAVQAAAQNIEHHARTVAEAADTPALQATGASLLQERLTASTALVAAAYRGASTIQLLTVSGNDAEKEIISLLNSPLFSKEAKQLYIVRKRSTPPVYFIFYGIFDSLEQARQVRNNMSFELRAHHPYPLAISDALLLNEG